MFWGLGFGVPYGTTIVRNLQACYWQSFPKGPSTQIVGFQDPKTTESMDFGTQNLTIWVLGPSGI